MGGKFITWKYTIITERLSSSPKVIPLVSGEAEFQPLSWQSSILNYQVPLFLWLQHQEATWQGEEASWTTFRCMNGIDGCARVGIILHGPNSGSFYPVTLLCVVSIFNIIF